MKATTSKIKSSTRQLVMSLLFVLCAFFVSAGLQPVLSGESISHDQANASSVMSVAETEKGHGTPTPISPPRQLPAGHQMAASVLAMALGI